MDKHVKKLVDNWLFDYPKVDKYIKDRLEELKHPFIEDRDENVGGGKSNVMSSPVENLVITIDDDKRLNALKRQKQAITRALYQVAPEVYNVIDRYYFKNEARFKTIRVILKDCGIGKSAFYEAMDKFYTDILKDLGIYHHLIKIPDKFRTK